MALTFLTTAGEPTHGRVEYDYEAEAFDFEPLKERPLQGSLVAQYLQLFVEEASQVVASVAGRSAYASWRSESIGSPPAIAGAVRVFLSEGNFIPGVAVEVPNAWSWASFVDRDSGWFRSGTIDTPLDLVFVEIAAGTVLELNGTSLSGIWLRPT